MVGKPTLELWTSVVKSLVCLVQYSTIAHSHKYITSSALEVKSEATYCHGNDDKGRPLNYRAGGPTR
jgi:hypothetical protein